MKVHFLKDVRGSGRAHEVKDVNDGYAQNFLLPNKLAEAATPAVLERIKVREARNKKEREIQDELWRELTRDLDRQTIEVSEKANEKGHLFSAVKEKEISAHILFQYKKLIPEEYIVLVSPIKTVGEFTVTLKKGPQEAHLTLSVKAK